MQGTVNAAIELKIKSIEISNTAIVIKSTITDVKVVKIIYTFLVFYYRVISSSGLS